MARNTHHVVCWKRIGVTFPVKGSTVIHSPAVIAMFGYNAELMLKQTHAMTHAESIRQPAPGGNSMNWLLGHIISSRMRALHLVGEPPLWDDARRAPYRSGAPPWAADSPEALPLAELIADFTQSQERLITGLRRMTYADVCRPSGYQTHTIGESLAYIRFHEAQHVGQILYIAPLSGVPAVWLNT
jgi:uncharacterized damage-inducible protein DinB